MLDAVHCNPGAVMEPRVAAPACRTALLLLVLAGAVFPVAAAPVDAAGWQAYARGDYVAARSLFEEKARADDRLAQYNLAMMLLRGEGGASDPEAGARWLRKAADAGMVQAQYNLALLYEGGIGVPRSLTAATEWWEKAAKHGHTEAQVELATQYFLGRGAPKDWKLAARWYEAAAENGDAGAQYIIGSFYEHGDGVAQDLRKALEWYVAAARQGDVGAAVQAKDVARRISATASPGPRDP
jgi:uncharacterized protein